MSNAFNSFLGFRQPSNNGNPTAPPMPEVADRFSQLNQFTDRSQFSPMEEALCSKVRLTISAKKLKDLDVFSKSDPMCVVYLSSGLVRGNDQYREAGRTETVMNCLNPEWNSKILVDYYFEEVQKIRFEVYDVDSPSKSLKDHDFIGSIETTLGEIVGAPCSRKTFLLEDRHSRCGRRGEITIVAEDEGTTSSEIISFLCHALSVDKKDFFGKSDPFLNIYRINDDGMKHLVYRTEVIKNTLNPSWKPFELTMQQLCSGDKQRKLIIECFDYDNNGGSSHDFIGSCETSVQRLLDGMDTNFLLINEKKKQKKGKCYTDSGRLFFDSVKIRKRYTFLEYITGNTELEFAVAVDMTASNGAPNTPESLHYIFGQEPNEYQIAIHAIADICQHYNNSKVFDAMGFGAKLPGISPSIVQHCFPLDWDSKSYNVVGVPGLVRAYQDCITSCILFGPTNFAPLIHRVAQKAHQFPKDGSRYQVLLIITDGCICDFEQTKETIVNASSLPLSIIIVGVGSSNFDRMDDLDSDDQLLTSHGKQAQRDIVQFVPLRKFLQTTNCSGDYVLSMALLAKEVLEEIPEQLTSYMDMHGIKPRPATGSGARSSQLQDFENTNDANTSHRLSQYQNIVPPPLAATQHNGYSGSATQIAPASARSSQVYSTNMGSPPRAATQDFGYAGSVAQAAPALARNSQIYSSISGPSTPVYAQDHLPSARLSQMPPAYLPPNRSSSQAAYSSGYSSGAPGTPLSNNSQDQRPRSSQQRPSLLVDDDYPNKNEPPPPYSSIY